MLTEVEAGDYNIRGVSLGGIYTSLHVPQLHSLFDVGMALRTTAGVRHLFLSHAHADHSGAIISLLGLRGLLGNPPPLKLYLPSEVAAPLSELIANWSKLQRYPFPLNVTPMEPGDEVPIGGNLIARAFRTYHPVPSLGYEFVRKVTKLKDEFRSLEGKEIERRKRAGEDIFYEQTRSEFAYATDTLISVLDHEPQLYETEVLVMECTFLDEKKTLKDARAGCHIHLDEILERADKFKNKHLVLMHFSQLYQPSDVLEILDARCPESLRKKIVPFAPKSYWPG